MIGGEAARRYARALVDIAERQNVLDEVGEELSALADALEHPELRRILLNPRFSRPVRTQIRESIMDSSSASELMRKFGRLVAEKDRIADLSGISQHYQALADEAKGRVRAQVRTAFDLSSASLEELSAKLSEVTGKEVLLEVEKDESLIGGLVCRMGGIVIDGSIKNQLKNLRDSLITN